MRSARQSQYQEIRNLLKHADQQIRRSQQLFPHELTVTNHSDQDLTFTINIEDPESHDPTPITLPAQSVFTRKIYSPHEHLNAICPALQQIKPWSKNMQEEQPILTKIRQSSSNVKPSDQKKKILPFKNFETKGQEKPILYEQQKLSKGKEVGKSGLGKHSSTKTDLSRAEYDRTPYDTYKKDFQTKESTQSINKKPDFKGEIFQIKQFSADSKTRPEYVNNNINITTPMKSFHDQAVQSDSKAFPFSLDKSGVEQSPHVYDYLLGMIRERDPDFSIPVNPDSKKDDAMSFNQSFFSNTNIKPKIRQNSQAIADKMKPNNINLEPKESNNKTYKEIIKQKSALKDKKQYKATNLNKRTITSPARQSPQSSTQRLPYRPSSDKKNKSLIQIQQEKSNVSNHKADDLFQERKTKFLNKLEDKVKKVYTNSKIRPRNGDESKYPKTKDHPTSIDKQTKISSKAAQISQRLYQRSKDKIPCWHELRYYKEIQRERFDNIVRQNSFVGRHVGIDEQDMLFQTLRQSGEGVSIWPMKIVNYTYSKISRQNDTDTQQ